MGDVVARVSLPRGGQSDAHVPRPSTTRRQGHTDIRSKLKLALVPLLAVLLIAGIAPQSGDAATTSARTLLGRLAVAGERGSSAYDRDKFKHWTDRNGDCQDTRAEVLIKETRAPVTFTTSRHCTVATGQWYSYYDGKTWTQAGDVDIDHMVALREAWESGARSWTASDRTRYANDGGIAPSLAAVTDNVNQSKGDRNPADWMPSRSSVRCK